VYWIGGGSGAGKTSVARRLADAHRLRLYSTDEVMSDHARRCPPDEGPELHRFLAMDMDERWVRRSPEEMLETFHWFRGEGFSLIVEDLLGIVGEGPVVVEGFRLLPSLVEPLLGRRGRAVWLLPSPGFRRAAFARRGSQWRIAGRTSDPERALDNLLARDRMFTDRLRREVERLGLTAIAVDGGIDEHELASRVAAEFELAV
jgi:hypothetical protein